MPPLEVHELSELLCTPCLLREHLAALALHESFRVSNFSTVPLPPTSFDLPTCPFFFSVVLLPVFTAFLAALHWPCRVFSSALSVVGATLVDLRMCRSLGKLVHPIHHPRVSNIHLTTLGNKVNRDAAWQYAVRVLAPCSNMATRPSPLTDGRFWKEKK